MTPHGAQDTPTAAGHLRIAASLSWSAAPRTASVYCGLSLLIALAPAAAAALVRTLLDRRTVEAAVALAAFGLVAAVTLTLRGDLRERLLRQIASQNQDRLYAILADLPGIGRLEHPGFPEELKLAQASGPGRIAGEALRAAEVLLSAAGLLALLAAVHPGLCALVLAGGVAAYAGRARFVSTAFAAGLAGAAIVWGVRLPATPGDLVVLVTAAVAAYAGGQALAHHLAATRTALAMFRRYRALETAAAQACRPTPSAALGALTEGIELADVWFRYAPDRPWVLRGVSFTIPYGQSVAVAGLSGAGKSTLVKLLCRFHEPTLGSIRWDGCDIRRMRAEDVRSRIGAVFPDFLRFDLCAGIALARAFVRDDADLMILDEPLSGLGAYAEYEMQQRLRKRRAGRTSLLVSHRPAAVRQADLIVVLAGGKVVETGRHEELLARAGAYANLVRLQVFSGSVHERS
jgi:ABC-type Na+ transport system ATPase subunit NatA